MQPLNFEEVLQRIITRDSRYHRDAYLFLREALDHTQKRLGATAAGKIEPRHVSGQELLAGLRDYALSQYGPMTKTLLNEWNIRTCEDFGEIVFNMVEGGLLSKTKTDTRDDFKPGFNFDEAFLNPFKPQPREALQTPPETKAGQT